MARASMQALIDRLRKMTDASRTDRFNDITYWTDDQLQEVLDESRVSRPIRVPLKAGTNYLNGEEQWGIQSLTFPKSYGIEDDFPVYSDSGVLVDPANYTYSYYGPELIVVFNTNTVEVDDYEAELTLYDLYRAAAEVFGRMASQRRALVEIRSGVHQIKAQHEVDHLERREKFYRTRVAKVFDLPNKRRFKSSTSTAR